jgi:predicted permease
MSLLSRLFRSRKNELDEEIQSHLRMAILDHIERGMAPEEARIAAMRDFGNVPLVEDMTREAWGCLWLERLGQDFRYSLRQIRRSPAFAATVIGTLALGIGAAAAMFTIVDHVLLRPVPYKDPGRLVVISESDGKGAAAWLAPWLNIEQWMKQSRSFEQIAFSTGMYGRNYLEGNTAALKIQGEQISSNLFGVLGVQPALGRGFIPEAPSFVAGKNAGTIVLSNAVWQEAFGGDPRILGQGVKINDASYTVVGVMPPGFRYPDGTAMAGEVWTAIQLGEKDKGRDPGAANYQVIGRLRQGATAKTASAEMSLIQKRVAAGYTDPDVRKRRSAISIEKYGNRLVNADVRKALLALLAASGVLWLIASVNGTNLLLARSMARQREIAMRGALGASRWRVVQQMMVEGLVLSGAAALLGFALALGSVKLLAHELSQHLPIAAPARPNASILLVLLGLTVFSAVLSTAWPTFLAVHAPIEPALKQGEMQTGMGRRHHQLRSALVAAEVAMSLVLLAACGLLLQTIYTLRHVPLGYRTDHIIVADLNIPAFRFAGRNMTHALYEPMLERVQHLHGVESAGLVSEVPLSQTRAVRLEIQMNGYPIVSFIKAVSPEMQQVFGFRMAAGRFFDTEDTATSQPVVVVNQTFARLYAPDKHDPAAILGTKLLDLRKNEPMQIVGILDDERQSRVADAAQPEVEVAIPQLTPDAIFYMAMDGTTMDVAVRTERPTVEMIPELRDILGHASPEFQNATMTTMDQIVEDSYGSQRLAAHVLEIFGGSALLLCVAGLYGLLAYVVTQRKRELGVRIALGARRGNLLWLVMRQAGAMLLAGVAVGGALALASGRLVRGFLYGVSAHDGWTLAGAAALLLASGMMAAYLPARRAAGVDPMEALRTE